MVPTADCCNDSGKDRIPLSRKTERQETDYSSSFQSTVGMTTGKTGEGFPRWMRPASPASRLERSRRKSVNSVDFQEHDLSHKKQHCLNFFLSSSFFFIFFTHKYFYTK